MSYTPITNLQLRVLQEIVDFLQARGWDVTRLNIYRYDQNEGGPFDPPAEDWQSEHMKWGIAIQTSPRDQEAVLTSYKVRGPLTA